MLDPESQRGAPDLDSQSQTLAPPTPSSSQKTPLQPGIKTTPSNKISTSSTNGPPTIDPASSSKETLPIAPQKAHWDFKLSKAYIQVAGEKVYHKGELIQESKTEGDMSGVLAEFDLGLVSHVVFVGSSELTIVGFFFW